MNSNTNTESVDAMEQEGVAVAIAGSSNYFRQNQTQSVTKFGENYNPQDIEVRMVNDAKVLQALYFN